MPGALAQGLIWAIMAIGVYLTFRILDVADLTVDGTLGLGGAVCIMCMTSGMNVWLSLLLAFGAGLLAGLVTGLFHTLMVVVIAILYWFFGTELGCSIRATGCNANMARAQGINTNFNIVLGLMLSNGLVAFSGALLSQYQGFADVQMGRGAIVIGLAAVVIGEAVFSKIFRNFALKLLSVGIGSIIYYIVMQICIWFKIDTDLLKMLSAIVVAIFLAVPYWKAKYFTRVAVKKGGSSNA